MELKQYWTIVRKRLWMIALIVIIFCLSTGIYSYYLVKPQYEATAKLIVNDYKGSSSLLTTMDLGAIDSTVKLIKTYKEIIKTPRIMKQVASDYPQLNESYGDLIGKVNVSSVNETQVMSISVKDESYGHAAQIANAVALVFQKSVPSLMKVDNISVLDQADPSESHGPVAPNPKMNIAVAFMLGLMLGIGIAFLLDYLDDSINTEEDVERILGLPVLTSIPRIREQDLKDASRLMPAKPIAGRENNVSFDV
ncbi:YveK family protein [Paenibacillus protaetiae]|uniref:Lipopolysaccharide biosynthesis protein n=1 Tax=Paenibacillus protaetiae TaxID=2509456 RepID=A0A4P6F2B4_9BACL|nr:Wzz/FepE/Etk N-terminal domain-containing protein [Paenibacillus protaetiae]QAY67217.1 lipopolysaccharide biosynthesis protein [Paenibacillus protaetiae]